MTATSAIDHARPAAGRRLATWAVGGTLAVLLAGCGGAGPADDQVAPAGASATAPGEAAGAGTPHDAAAGTSERDADLPTSALVPSADTLSVEEARATHPEWFGADPLAGSWWVTTRELSYLGFRLELEAAKAGGTYAGHATCFDWRATVDPATLRGVSRPVDVSAWWNADAATGEVSGPMPMLHADGAPNGYSGLWRLVKLVRHTGPDDVPWITGTLIHTELTDADGMPVALRRRFRSWERSRPR